MLKLIIISCSLKLNYIPVSLIKNNQNYHEILYKVPIIYKVD